MLAEADPLTLIRLFSLYPVSSLKEKWPDQKKKTEAATWAAGNVAAGEIRQFLNEYFSCCKQHVYLFSHQNDVNDLPGFRLPDSEKLLESEVRKGRYLLYLAEVEYHVVFTDPLGEDRIKFLWPIRLEFGRDYLIARFVMMEKDIRVYFGPGASRTVGRSLTEASVISHLRNVLDDLKPLDINKGIKYLWDKDRFDGIRTKYRKPNSMVTEAMDAGKGIKATYPDTYKVMVKSPLYDCIFKMDAEDKTSIKNFSSDPTSGYLGFSAYSENKGDTDSFVSEIIGHN